MKDFKKQIEVRKYFRRSIDISEIPGVSNTPDKRSLESIVNAKEMKRY